MVKFLYKYKGSKGEFLMITVYSLGKFQLLNHDKTLDENEIRSDMLTKLLIYMVVHREHPITIQELSEALWNEDETENPAGALKNLMYRLRGILKAKLGKEDYILTNRGVYYWNPEIDIYFDAEQFERNCKEARRGTTVSEQIENYEKAIALYQGDFMSRVMDKHWIITLSAYYRSLFLSAVKTLAERYMTDERYEDVERICEEGLKYDEMDEWLHCHKITALIRQNKQQLAQECYEQAIKVLHDALGIRNSKQLEMVQQELLKMKKGIEAEGLESVHMDMQEQDAQEGAYICGYPVFREIYRLEARKNSRLKNSQYIMLLTLQIKEEALPQNEQMKTYILKQAMNQMEEMLRQFLRVGDVAARYSDSQFVVLLPACTYENCLMVSKRIVAHFMDKNKGKRVLVKTDFEELINSPSLIKISEK